MVEVVNETCVLTQACFCLKKYPPHLDGKLFEVLEREGYHLGVLEKPPDFQKDLTSPHHFMEIFVWVPIHSFGTRQSCSPLLFGVVDFSNFITRQSNGSFARRFRKPQVQNLLTRVCKPLGQSHKKMTTGLSSYVGLWNFNIGTRLLVPHPLGIQSSTLMHSKQIPAATRAASGLKKATNDHFLAVLIPG